MFHFVCNVVRSSTTTQLNVATLYIYNTSVIRIRVETQNMIIYYTIFDNFVSVIPSPIFVLINVTGKLVWRFWLKLIRNTTIEVWS